MTILMLLLNILLLVTGQALWKTGLDHTGGLGWTNLLQVLLSPLILSGIACYGLATILWLGVLSRMPLSVAYPLQSLAYAGGLFLAWYVFGEAVPLTRWIGTGLIVVGVIVVAAK